MATKQPRSLKTSTHNNILLLIPMKVPTKSHSVSAIPRSRSPRMEKTPVIRSKQAERGRHRAAFRADGIPTFPTRGGELQGGRIDRLAGG